MLISSKSEFPLKSTENLIKQSAWLDMLLLHLQLFLLAMAPLESASLHSIHYLNRNLPSLIS